MKGLLIVDRNNRMPLLEWQDAIDELITEYGPRTILSLTTPGDGSEEVALYLEIPEPPERPADGEYKSWEEYLTDPLKGNHTVRFDIQDRPCPTMKQLFRARQEGTFPIRYWLESINGN